MPPGNAFWRFSLRTWRVPGVRTACLDLQERCGADVNLLLFCAWTGRRKRLLSRRSLREALERVKPWQTDVIAPMRLARRNLKRLGAGSIAAALGQPFRARLAALELDLERAEQSLLAQLESEWGPASEVAPSREAVAANLARYLELLPASPWPSDLAHLDTIAAAALPPARAQPARPSQACGGSSQSIRA